MKIFFIFFFHFGFALNFYTQSVCTFVSNQLKRIRLLIVWRTRFVVDCAETHTFSFIFVLFFDLTKMIKKKKRNEKRETIVQMKIEVRFWLDLWWNSNELRCFVLLNSFCGTGPTQKRHAKWKAYKHWNSSVTSCWRRERRGSK